MAGAVHRASWRSCGARRWPAAGCRVAGAVQIASWLPLAWQAQYTVPPGGAAARLAGAVQIASWLPLAWQAQYTEPPGGDAARVGAGGLRLPFAWQAQYTEPPGGAAARVGAAGPRLPLPWQVQYTEPPGEAAARVGAAGPRLPFAWQAQYTEPSVRPLRLTGNIETTVYHSATFSHIDSSVHFIFLLPHHLCQVPYTAQNDDA